MHILFISMFVTLGLVMSNVVASSEVITDMNATEKAGKTAYEIWREKRLDAYSKYRSEYLERYNNYRLDIVRRWGIPELSDATNYVSYSDDLSKKVVIDYDNNQIRVSVLEKQDSPAEIDIEHELGKLARRTVKTALADDPVMAQSGNNDTRSLLGSVLGELLGSVSEEGGAGSSAASATLAKNARVEVVPLPLSAASEAVVQQQVLKESQGQTTSSPRSDELNKNQKAISEAFAKARKQQSKEKHRIRTYVVALPEDTMLKRAVHYVQPIAVSAKKYGLEPALVYAITQTESAFNPLARSHIPAFGLMQIVPSSAGVDVNKLLNKSGRAPAVDILLNAEENIKFGTAYLHILNSRYLSQITNEESRLYCMIAAYNTGSGNVASVFHPQGKKRIKAAAQVINSLSPDEVYARLLKELPYEETRRYLKKVNTAMKKYQNALDHGQVLRQGA